MVSVILLWMTLLSSSSPLNLIGIRTINKSVAFPSFILKSRSRDSNNNKPQVLVISVPLLNSAGRYKGYEEPG